MSKIVIIHCPDCRGKFQIFDITEFQEGDILECSLCGHELLLEQENPLQVRNLTENDY